MYNELVRTRLIRLQLLYILLKHVYQLTTVDEKLSRAEVLS